MLQHCPTYNSFEDHKWILERVYDVNQDKNYKGDINTAMGLTDYSQPKIATGILYEDTKSISYIDRLQYRTNIKTALKDEVESFSISEVVKSYI